MDAEAYLHTQNSYQRRFGTRETHLVQALGAGVSHQYECVEKSTRYRGAVVSLLDEPLDSPKSVTGMCNADAILSQVIVPFAGFNQAVQSVP